MSVDRTATVTTGREFVRKVCPSCEQRFKIGEPVAQDTWPARLTLSPLQLDLLLVAAAEFRNLSNHCDSCNHDPHGDSCVAEEEEVACLCDLYVPRGHDDAISFVDWVKPDALSLTYGSAVSLRNGNELR